MGGRWFPGWRPATRAQWRAYRDACWKLFRNSRYEEKAGIRTETTRYLNLNDQVWATGRPLSRTQQIWHWQRALTAEDRDMERLQRIADRASRRRSLRSRRQRSRSR